MRLNVEAYHFKAAQRITSMSKVCHEEVVFFCSLALASLTLGSGVVLGHWVRGNADTAFPWPGAIIDRAA